MSLTLDPHIGIGAEGHSVGDDDDSGVDFIHEEARKAIEASGDGVASILESQVRVRLAGHIESRRSKLESLLGGRFSTKKMVERIMPKFSDRIASDAAQIVRESAGVDFSVQAGPIALRYLADLQDDELAESMNPALSS